MALLFVYRGDFNDDLTLWDTSRVTDMKLMFLRAHSINGYISSEYIQCYKYGWIIFKYNFLQWRSIVLGYVKGNGYGGLMFYEATSFRQKL